MSTQSPPVQPTRALSPVEQKQVALNSYLKSRMASFNQVLPQHLTAERMVRCALTAAVKNPSLLEYAHENPSSFALAIMQASELGLEPDTPSQFCHLIPYTISQKSGDGWKKIKVVQFQIGYRGLLELINRAGEVKSFTIYDVHRGDDFKIELGKAPDVKHNPDVDALNRDWSTFRLVYGVVVFNDGSIVIDYMNKAQIEVVKNAVAKKNFGKAGPAWEEHPIEQAKKTLIKRMAKTLPKSSEKMEKVDEVIEKDNTIEFGPMDVDPNAVIVDQETGEVVTETPRTKTGRVEQKLKESAKKPEPDLPEAPPPTDEIAPTSEVVESGYITAEQVAFFNNLCKSRGFEEAGVRIYLANFHKVDSVERIPIDKYDKLVNTMKAVHTESINNLAKVDPKLL